MQPRSRFLLSSWYVAFLLVATVPAQEQTDRRWVGSWATALLAAPPGPDEPALAGATLRQVVRVSLGGGALRLRLSNAFGREPLELHGVSLAVVGPGGAILPGTDRPLRYNGAGSVTIPPGAVIVSDPIDFALAPLSDLAVSMHLKSVPATLTVHPGSRTTSYVQAGDVRSAAALPEAAKIVRWFFLAGIEVWTDSPQAAALVLLGDSITDGYGCTTDGNDRWTDALAHRLHRGPEARPVGVLNAGIGGNRLLRDGLGPNILARFDRDVLVQPGVRWVVILAGINDIGTRLEARRRGEDYASAADLIAAYKQLIARARVQGVRVIGATLTPYKGADFYWSEDGEADRQAVNDWIRGSGRFDAVIDFDAALRDPQDPLRLAEAFDSGDHLHPSLAGYREMARVVDLSLFAAGASSGAETRSVFDETVTGNHRP